MRFPGTLEAIVAALRTVQEAVQTVLHGGHPPAGDGSGPAAAKAFTPLCRKGERE